MENNQVAIINNSIEVFKTAPEILKQNQERTNKALVVGNSIIESWATAYTIENETEKLEALAKADERSNSFLVKANDALKQQKELRAPITQLMDSFKSMFTEAENQLDKTKTGNVVNKIQTERNNYVTELARINKEKLQEAERVANKAKEEIELSGSCEKLLNELLQSKLSGYKNELNNQLNNLQLEGFADDAAQIRLAFNEFDFMGMWMEFKVGSKLGYKYHSVEEVKSIVETVKGKLTIKANQEFIEELTLFKNSIVDKIPSKQNELKEAAALEEQRLKAEEELKLAKDAEAKKVAEQKAAQLKIEQENAAKEKQEREEKEKADIKLKEQEELKKSNQEIEIKQQGESTMAMFEQQAAIAETVAPAVKESYLINIKHPVGYTQIFALWFEKVGKDLPIDKLGNTKLDQMKTWVEKEALKTGAKIESKFLEYTEVFKAVNKK